MNPTLPSSQVSQKLNVAISMEFIFSRTQNKNSNCDCQRLGKSATAVSIKLTVTPLQSLTKLKEFGQEQPMRRENLDSQNKRSEARKSPMFLKNYPMALLLKKSQECKESKSPQFSDCCKGQSKKELSNESQNINNYYRITFNFSNDLGNDDKWSLISIQETTSSNGKGFRSFGNERSRSHQFIDRSIASAKISSLFPQYLDEGKQNESFSC